MRIKKNKNKDNVIYLVYLVPEKQSKAKKNPDDVLWWSPLRPFSEKKKEKKLRMVPFVELLNTSYFSFENRFSFK